MNKNNLQRNYRRSRFYLKSFGFLIALIIISFFPIYYLSAGIFSNNLTLIQIINATFKQPTFDLISTIFLACPFIISCILILLSGLNIFKRGLRYGGYFLGICFLEFIYELYRINDSISQNVGLNFLGVHVYPNIAFFGIIIILYLIITTRKK